MPGKFQFMFKNHSSLSLVTAQLLVISNHQKTGLYLFRFSFLSFFALFVSFLALADALFTQTKRVSYDSVSVVKLRAKCANTLHTILVLVESSRRKRLIFVDFTRVSRRIFEFRCCFSAKFFEYVYRNCICNFRRLRCAHFSAVARVFARF